MMVDDELHVVEADGSEHTLDVLFSFENGQTGKTYVIYTEQIRDEDGNIVVNASVYEPEGVLAPVETEAEWAMIQLLLEELERRIHAGESVDDLEDWINRIAQSGEE